MVHLYVLYACVYVVAGKHAPRAGTTRCDESQVFFQADECRKEIPKKHGGLIEKTRQSRSWLECQDTSADSWIPADANDPGNRLYKAEADVSDESALAALLAPLPQQARATFAPSDFRHPIQRTFQGSGSLSFFVVGTGSSVMVFAVSNLDDFQFADMATDFSSAAAAMTIEKEFDFATMAEDAGVQLSHHTEISHRDMPPPGGMATEP